MAISIKNSFKTTNHFLEISMIHFLTVNYYSKELIKKLVLSINNSLKSAYQITIVNNSPQEELSNDDFFPSEMIYIIQSPQNLGFGAGCNLGIKYIYSVNNKALIWLINPDTTIDKEADIYLKKCFDTEPNLAILGTKIRDIKGNLWFGQGLFDPFWGTIKHEAKLSNTINSQNGITSSRWVSGCSMIINLAKFDHCPSFNTRYFLYHEDVDFCEKYYKENYQIAVTNHILVTHVVSAIIGKDKKNMFKNFTFSRLVFLELYGSKLSFLIYMFYVILFKITILMIFDTSNAIGRWQGIKKYFTNSHP